MPRYVRAWGYQEKRKLVWPFATIVCGREMLRALDFGKFIFKLDNLWKRLKSCSRLGIVIKGLERKRWMSSAYAANLYCLCLISIPVMFGLVLSLCKKGSSESTNIRVESGHPCRVPFEMEKASDRHPLTLILAVGEVYNAMIIWMKGAGNPIACSTAVM